MKRDLSFHGAIAVVIVALATIAGLELAVINVEAPYLVLLPGVIIAFAAGGVFTATIVILLGGVVTWFFFIPPVWSFQIPSYANSLTLLLFLAIMGLVCRILYVQRRTIDELASANIELRGKLLKVGSADALT